MAATQTVERITVEEIGQWGVKVDGEWYNFDQKSGVKGSQFTPNGVYDVSVAQSSTGKKYIHSILSAPTSTPAAKPQSKPVTSSRAPVDTNKDERILLQGAYQAALQSPAGVAFAATSAEYEAWVARQADLQVKYVKERLNAYVENPL